LSPPDAARPTFEEPWQAEAFALAVHLSAAGAFAWPDWAAALAAEIGAAGAGDDGQRYYEHWLAALERLALERGLVAPDALAARKSAWAEAYRRTPHGQPVTLAAAEGA
jgi:nitrile hydratase accessory protein